MDNRLTDSDYLLLLAQFKSIDTFDELSAWLTRNLPALITAARSSIKLRACLDDIEELLSDRDNSRGELDAGYFLGEIRKLVAVT